MAICVGVPGGLNELTRQTSYVHTDGLRSVVAETDATGVVTERRRYEPYGAPADGSYAQGPGYAGHVMDAATQLVYMQQQYYDPLAGRFLSVDPVGADAVNFNRYWYANNNPYKYIDPDGRCTGSHITNSDGTCKSTGEYTTSATTARGVSAAGRFETRERDTHKSTEKNSTTISASSSSGDVSESSANLLGLVKVSYQGYYHDKVVDDLVRDMRSKGIAVEKEVPVCLIGGACARLDIFGSSPTKVLFALEVKTGNRPDFTANQVAVYPHLRAGGLVQSPDPRVSSFGVSPGVPLPPIEGGLLYKNNESSPPFYVPFP